MREGKKELDPSMLQREELDAEDARAIAEELKVNASLTSLYLSSKGESDQAGGSPGDPEGRAARESPGHRTKSLNNIGRVLSSKGENDASRHVSTLEDRARFVTSILEDPAHGETPRSRASAAVSCEIRVIARAMVKAAGGAFMYSRTTIAGAAPSHIAITLLMGDEPYVELPGTPVVFPANASARSAFVKSAVRCDIEHLKRLIAYLSLGGKAADWDAMVKTNFADLARVLRSAAMYEAADLMERDDIDTHQQMLEHPLFWDDVRWRFWFLDAASRLRDGVDGGLRNDPVLRAIYADEVLGGNLSTDWSALPRVLLAQCCGIGIIPEHVDASRDPADPADTVTGRCRRHDHAVLVRALYGDKNSRVFRVKTCNQCGDVCATPGAHSTGFFCHCAVLRNPLLFHSEMRNIVEHAGDFEVQLLAEPLKRLRTLFGGLTKEDVLRTIRDDPDRLARPELGVAHDAVPPPQPAGAALPEMLRDRNPLLDLFNALRIYDLGAGGRQTRAEDGGTFAAAHNGGRTRASGGPMDLPRGDASPAPAPPADQPVKLGTTEAQQLNVVRGSSADPEWGPLARLREAGPRSHADDLTPDTAIATPLASLSRVRLVVDRLLYLVGNAGSAVHRLSLLQCEIASVVDRRRDAASSGGKLSAADGTDTVPRQLLDDRNAARARVIDAATRLVEEAPPSEVLARVAEDIDVCRRRCLASIDPGLDPSGEDGGGAMQSSDEWARLSSDVAYITSKADEWEQLLGDEYHPAAERVARSLLEDLSAKRDAMHDAEDSFDDAQSELQKAEKKAKRRGGGGESVFASHAAALEEARSARRDTRREYLRILEEVTHLSQTHFPELRQELDDRIVVDISVAGPLLRPGRTLDHYEILEEQIGTRAVHVVGLASRPVEGPDDVALRFADGDGGGGGASDGARVRVVLKRFDPRDDAERRRLMRNLRAVAQLEHPSIVPITAVFADGAACWVEMPCLRGGSLDSWLRVKERPEGAKRSVLVDALRAVEYIHARGYVHCDLKPANVLLTSEDDSARAVVADFDALAAMADASRAWNLTVSSMAGVTNTLRFLAPEAIGVLHATGPSWQPSDKERAILTSRARDVYALGVVAHDMFAPNPTFEVSALTPSYGIGEDLCGLLGSMLDKEPERRLNVTEVLSHRFFAVQRDDGSAPEDETRVICDALALKGELDELSREAARLAQCRDETLVHHSGVREPLEAALAELVKKDMEIRPRAREVRGRIHEFQDRLTTRADVLGPAVTSVTTRQLDQLEEWVSVDVLDAVAHPRPEDLASVRVIGRTRIGPRGNYLDVGFDGVRTIDEDDGTGVSDVVGAAGGGDAVSMPSSSTGQQLVGVDLELPALGPSCVRVLVPEGCFDGPVDVTLRRFADATFIGDRCLKGGGIRERIAPLVELVAVDARTGAKLPDSAFKKPVWLFVPHRLGAGTEATLELDAVRERVMVRSSPDGSPFEDGESAGSDAAGSGVIVGVTETHLEVELRSFGSLFESFMAVFGGCIAAASDLLVQLSWPESVDAGDILRVRFAVEEERVRDDCTYMKVPRGTTTLRLAACDLAEGLRPCSNGGSVECDLRVMEQGELAFKTPESTCASLSGKIRLLHDADDSEPREATFVVDVRSLPQSPRSSRSMFPAARATRSPSAASAASTNPGTPGLPAHSSSVLPVHTPGAPALTLVDHARHFAGLRSEAHHAILVRETRNVSEALVKAAKSAFDGLGANGARTTVAGAPPHDFGVEVDGDARVTVPRNRVPRLLSTTNEGLVVEIGVSRREDVGHLKRLIAYLCLGDTDAGDTWTDKCAHPRPLAEIAADLGAIAMYEAADLLLRDDLASHGSVLAHPLFWDAEKLEKWHADTGSRLRGGGLRADPVLRAIYADEVLGGGVSTDWSSLPPILLAQCSVTGILPEHADTSSDPADPSASVTGRCRRHDHGVLVRARDKTPVPSTGKKPKSFDSAKTCSEGDVCAKPAAHSTGKKPDGSGGFCHCAGAHNPLQFHSVMRNIVEHVGDFEAQLLAEPLKRLRTLFGGLTKRDVFRTVYEDPERLARPEVNVAHDAVPPPPPAGVTLPEMLRGRSSLLDLYNALRIYDARVSTST
jgi:serine/threonine protein kinase